MGGNCKIFLVIMFRLVILINSFVSAASIATSITTPTETADSLSISTFNISQAKFSAVRTTTADSSLDYIWCVGNKTNSDSVNIRQLDNCSKELANNMKNIFSLRMNKIEFMFLLANSQAENILSFSKIAVTLFQVKKNDSYSAAIFTQFYFPASFQEDSISETKSVSNQSLVTKSPLINTPVILMSAFDKNIEKLTKINVSFVVDIKNDSTINEFKKKENEASILNRKVVLSVSYVCSFYDVNSSSYSEEGCSLTNENSSNVTCQCNHTTIFAILLSLEWYQVPSDVKIISFILESISIISLIFTLVVLVQVRKKIVNDRTMVQINLSLALMIFHSVNIFHDLAIKNDTSCEILAVLLHYFLLSTATWMLVEGINLLLKITKRSMSHHSKNTKFWTKIRLSIGWGIPLVIVFVSAIIGFTTKTYMSKTSKYGYTKCWLSSESGTLLGAAIIPVLIIYCINAAVTAYVIIFLYKMQENEAQFKPTPKRKNASKIKSLDATPLKNTLKGVLLLFPVLGILWIFGFLAGVESYQVSLVFMYLNAIFNGLQGFFLMLIYCVFGSEVRKVWIKRYSRKITSSMFSLNANILTKIGSTSTGVAESSNTNM